MGKSQSNFLEENPKTKKSVKASFSFFGFVLLPCQSNRMLAILALWDPFLIPQRKQMQCLSMGKSQSNFLEKNPKTNKSVKALL